MLVWGICSCATCNARISCCTPSTSRHSNDVDPVEDANAIVRELKKYDAALHEKPRWLVLNKLDMVPAEERAQRVADFIKRFRWKGPVFQISALTREGRETLIRA